MKKFVAFITVISIIFSLIPVYAQTIDKEDLGIRFSISDEWIKTEKEKSIVFYHSTNKSEGISIEVLDDENTGNTYVMDAISDADFKTLCDTLLSDQNLAHNLMHSNFGRIKVTTESIVTGYEYYNGIKYYRYEKAHTAKADYFYNDTPLYATLFVTAQNGKLYLIMYVRDYKNPNHFTDVVDMLNNISYENGEIKIFINDERIYPDSAPYIVQDRTIVPIRAVAEKLGYTVEWDEITQTVTLTPAGEGDVLSFTIGSEYALANHSRKIYLDVPAIIIGSRTYLPLRAVAESMGASVRWNVEDNAVEIYK